jgi:DNA polymerase III delta prime subunit
MENNNVLIKVLRPKMLEDIIGMKSVIKGIKEQFESKRIPHFFLLSGASGSGKCLGYNTPIMMFDGKIKMSQDINIGELIMGDDNTPRNVLSITKGKEKMYKIIQNNGDDYVVNESHILSLKIEDSTEKLNECRINDKMYKYGDIIDISVKDYNKLDTNCKNCLKGFKVPLEFKNQELHLDPYLLGLWLGNNGSNELEITNKNSNILKCHLLYTGSKYDHQIAENILIGLNLINNKHIPDIYKYNSRENRLKILAGLLDANGHYNKNKKYYNIIEKNKQLSYDILYIVRSLGFISSLNVSNKHHKIYISSRKLYEIPCLITRKKAEENFGSDHEITYCIKVEEVEKEYYLQGENYEYYYGFEIDGNKRFMLGDCTVTHNTTISRIIALMLQDADPKDSIGKYDIREINASDKNGVDDMRTLIESVKYMPMSPSISKVVILDECHQLTTAAQNVLLKITEDVPPYLYFIFSTTNASKIIEALKRRAYIINTKGLNDKEIGKLLERASEEYESEKDYEPLKEELIELGIDSPGFILQAAEKFFNGHKISECIMTGDNSGIDTRKLCSLISKGDWKGSAEILSIIKKDDVPMIRICVSAYMKTILLKKSGDGAIAMAKAIKCLNENYDDLPCFLANICIACSCLKQ